MADNTGIEWADATWQIVTGCSVVSPGCTNCYAEAYDKRVGGVPKKQRVDPEVQQLRWGPNGARTRTSAANWKEPLKWNAAAEAAGERHRVFCASLADVFEERPELHAWRAELFSLIFSTPHLDWLLLTKRPEGFARFNFRTELGAPHSWPSNVWLGVTVENQEMADKRIPLLLEQPALVRFLSMEPLLGSVDLSAFMGGSYVGLPGDVVHDSWNAGISWVIIGGESGGNARPFHTEWARDLVTQCRRSVVAPFVKQMGSNPVDHEGCGDCDRCCARQKCTENVQVVMTLRDHHGGDMAEWPEYLRVREFPVAP